MDDLTSVDSWVAKLRSTILDQAAQNLETIKSISTDNAKVSVEDMPRIQMLLHEQQRIIDEISGITEDIGGRAAANVGSSAALIQAQLDAVNVAGSLGTFLSNLDFFMNENPSLAGQLAAGLAGVPARLGETLTQLTNQEFETWYDCIIHEKRRRDRLA